MMIKPARKLKKLLLPYCIWLTDEMLFIALTFCKEIECLDVSSHQITDQSLIPISQLDSLEEISLNNTKVTDEGIIKLLSECPKLTFLNVDYCSSVSFETLYKAYDLISQGSLNKQLVIRFGGETIPMNPLKDREDISGYDQIEYDSENSSSDYADSYSGSD
ncbi:uncharacterized protein LOC141855285 [Brevipalpus obovatus]|uniref:uncharacterized protein LOC141855285 n=1 Tax=Brevipalpus obovatus TaxID=246614 RepID=UPI003D9ECA31